MDGGSRRQGRWKVRTALVFWAITSHAAHAAGPCSVSDFSLEALKVEIKSKCDDNRCPRLVFAGNLQNNCKSPSSAKLRFVIYDKSKTPIEIIEDWTTAPMNLAPGDRHPFVRKSSNMWTPEMHSYTSEIIETRAW